MADVGGRKRAQAAALGYISTLSRWPIDFAEQNFTSSFKLSSIKSTIYHFVNMRHLSHGAMFLARRAPDLDLESLKCSAQLLHHNHKASAVTVIGTERAQYIQN